MKREQTLDLDIRGKAHPASSAACSATACGSGNSSFQQAIRLKQKLYVEFVLSVNPWWRTGREDADVMRLTVGAMGQSQTFAYVQMVKLLLKTCH